MNALNKRHKEIIYFGLSRLLDCNDLSQQEFNEIDTLRGSFKEEIKELLSSEA